MFDVAAGTRTIFLSTREVGAGRYRVVLLNITPLGVGTNLFTTKKAAATAKNHFFTVDSLAELPGVLELTEAHGFYSGQPFVFQVNAVQIKDMLHLTEHNFYRLSTPYTSEMSI